MINTYLSPINTHFFYLFYNVFLCTTNCCFTTNRIKLLISFLIPIWGITTIGSIVIKGVMGITSIIASSIFIWMIRRSHDGFSTTQHRILAGLCISDIILSLHFASFGILMPVEVNYWSWNARGSMATCRLDTFLGEFGGGLGLWYNASLVRLD